jgi:hypothetical protein
MYMKHAAAFKGITDEKLSVVERCYFRAMAFHALDLLELEEKRPILWWGPHPGSA